MLVFNVLINIINKNMNHKTIGDTLPDVTFKTRIRDESVDGENPFRWEDKTTDDIFAGKKVVLFALPGAFTPTCSSSHLPGYDDKYQEFKDLGIDEVICLSVNDAFVMYKWGLDRDVKNLYLLPDGNAEFTDKMGMLVSKENLGFGSRSWRYSMMIDDKKIKHLFTEEGMTDNCKDDPFSVSSAETMLKELRG